MLYLIRLKFLSPVHFGEVGIGIEHTEETVHSDSLFSALCHAWGVLYGKRDLDDLLGTFDGTPPFLLSSGFLYREDTFFLPKPLSMPPGFDDLCVREKFGKKMKKTCYLPLKIFQQWVQGAPIDYDDLGEEIRYEEGFGVFLVPRVALDRVYATSELFQCGLVSFREGCGIYVLLKAEDEGMVSKIRHALSLLGEMGLGGERTYGYGRFEAEVHPAGERWERLFEPRGDRSVLLSLYHPDVPVSEILEGASYDLQERRGWIHSPFSKKQFKRKTVTMFKEGSIFKGMLRGHLVDVTPSIWDRARLHPVFRYGFALTAPICTANA